MARVNQIRSRLRVISYDNIITLPIIRVSALGLDLNCRASSLAPHSPFCRL